MHPKEGIGTHPKEISALNIVQYRTTKEGCTLQIEEAVQLFQAQKSRQSSQQSFGMIF